MLDLLKDTIIDILKLMPFLFLAFLILEYLEHKMSDTNTKYLMNNKKIGPFLGGILGAFPQCGFSAMATRLFSSRVITLGTLMAIYLSTSDEMLPILLSTGTNFLTIVKIIGLKLIIGIFCGYLIDFFYRGRKYQHEIHDLCEEEDCHCEKGIIISSIHHTLKIIVYLFIITFVINIIIYFVGEEHIRTFLSNGRGFTYFISSLIGLIPNCASSVIITELYLSKMITLGALISGLLTGAGVGLLVLFKTNKKVKENFVILFFLYAIGVIFGYIVDLIGIIV